MPVLNQIMTKLFGSKYERDKKQILPIVEKIKAVSPELEKLSNDELRERSQKLKATIQGSVKDEQAKIEELKKRVEAEKLDIEERENIYKEIDRLENDITKKLDEV